MESLRATSTNEECYVQLNRILNSTSFQDAPSSKRLLEYIANCSLDGRGDNLKEFTIGVNALGRRSDFDPKVDTIVRVQVRRLRQKITQYYESEGVHDRILLTIPRGRYAAEFSTLNTSQESDLSSLVASEEKEMDNLPQAAKTDQVLLTTRGRHWLFLSLLIVAALIGGTLLGYAYGRPHLAVTASDPVTQLWSAMLRGDSSPIIGYPDAVFLLDSSSDMFQFQEGPVGARGEPVDPKVAAKFAANPQLVAKAGPLYYESGGYTGTGEIESVANLVVLLQKLDFHPQLKRSHKITVDDLRNHNVILLGAASQNKAVKDILSPGLFETEFAFRNTGGIWGGSIVNLHPRPREATTLRVERDPVSQTVRTDYALISCMPGVDTLHRIISIGGMDTNGTAGATSYLTSIGGAEAMRTAFQHNDQRPFFQAVIRVPLINGDQVVRGEPVAVRPIH